MDKGETANAAWNHFLKEGLIPAETPDSIGPYLVCRFPFDKMTKKFGRSYIEYLACCWAAWDPSLGSEITFLDYHGIPLSFFEKTVKPMASTYHRGN